MIKGLGLWRLKLLFYGVWNEGPKEGYGTACAKAIGNLQFFTAANNLPPAPLRSGDDFHHFHFMTGHDHHHMTLFAGYSLMSACQVPAVCVIHTDGTIDERTESRLKHVLPSCVVVQTEETNDRLDDFLPVSKYPVLRKHRNEFPLMRKLTDTHSWRPGWNVFLDSDMLFFRHPQWLLDWQKNPSAPCCMYDIMDSYGYSDAVIAGMLPYPMPSRVNTGICGLNSYQIDWDKLEYWTKHLLETAGRSHFLEQAITAMALGGGEFVYTPPKDYLCHPDVDETKHPTAVMHHYVARSRTSFYRYGWRHIR